MVVGFAGGGTPGHLFMGGGVFRKKMSFFVMNNTCRRIQIWIDFKGVRSVWALVVQITPLITPLLWRRQHCRTDHGTPSVITDYTVRESVDTRTPITLTSGGNTSKLEL